MRGALGLALFLTGAAIAWLVVIDKFPRIGGTGDTSPTGGDPNIGQAGGPGYNPSNGNQHGVGA